MRNTSLILLSLVFLASCGTQRAISKTANKAIFSKKTLQTAHVGLAIYDPAAGKYLYQHQSNKYFVPASNTKIVTCYAAMKYLGDSLLSFRVQENNDNLIVEPCGDPSFLLSEFSFQPAWEKLAASNKPLFYRYNLNNTISAFGSGWSWDDFQESYLAERSAMPIYGNLVRFEAKGNQFFATPKLVTGLPFMKEPMMQLLARGSKFSVSRSLDQNEFQLIPSTKTFTSTTIPFKTMNGQVSIQFLKDTLAAVGKDIQILPEFEKAPIANLYSIPTDSLLKPLMHRSDNFFAEQSLLMVSYRRFGYMNDHKIIDTLLATDLLDLPQRPRWADGSGLSRYNLFTPQDFVQILNKMKNEFGMDRVKGIFETGGEGTISSYYKDAKGFIYAKTGSLSGVIAFSGFLYTKKGKLLLFSTLVNNHQTSASDVRKSIEQFLLSVRENY